MRSGLVIGAGPAGLMAAETMAKEGLSVTVADRKPSVARKFLMAGKSGLNLTKNEDDLAFLAAFRESAAWLAPMIERFGVAEVMAWAEDLGQPIYTGSTGRVFPKAMKASPLLRAWLHRIDDLGVERRVNWRWTGWSGDAVSFETPTGVQNVECDVVVLALGGASWARLGSSGSWANHLEAEGAEVTPFQPANSGVLVDWSEHMARHMGSPVKNIAMQAGDMRSRGEIILSQTGIEGGGIYTLTPALRNGAGLDVDLLPDLSEKTVASKLIKPRGKMSMGTYLRKALKLEPEKIGLLNEFARPLPEDAAVLARLVKGLSVKINGLSPLDEAISTVGGVPQSAVDQNLMLKAKKGVFVAGEMLDWDAPTGGYLITACLATGAWAGTAAAEFAGRG